jgi:hypothetical protein
MQNYSGFSGRIRILKERIQNWISKNGEPPVGSRAWEAKLEVEKLPRIIDERLERLSRGGLDAGAETTLRVDIENLQQQLAQHQQTLDEMDTSPGVGFVAAESKYHRVNEEAKAAGYPEPPEGHYYEIRGKDNQGNTVYGLRKFDSRSPNHRPDVEQQRVVKQPDGTFKIESAGERRTDQDRRNDIIREHGNRQAFEDLEKAIADGKLPQDVAAYIRSQEKALKICQEYELDLTALTRDLPTSYEQATEKFRKTMRQQLQQKFAALTPEKARKLFDELKPVVESRTQGEIFTALQRAQAANSGIMTLDTSVTNIEGTKRSGDRAIEITNQLAEDAPPPGRYLVDDKGGAAAFDKKQAQRYSDFLDKSDPPGQIRAEGAAGAKPETYDGVVYIFDSEAAARAARTYVDANSLHQNIYMGFYDQNGNQHWLSRRN